MGSPVHLPLHALLAALPVTAGSAGVQDSGDVPVTIKELDVEDAIREFRAFQSRLGEFREEIGQGQSIAQETSQILQELRSTANETNGFNEAPILDTIAAYVDGVLLKQVELVDFLDSQRYRISYYANKMASSVKPEDLALIFGTEEGNDAAIASHVESLDSAQKQLAEFIDRLPAGQFDRETFRPTRDMPRDERRKLDALVFQYQNEKNTLEFAKRRLLLVRAAQRHAGSQELEFEVNADLLVGQMFGALDRVRLQMSMDFLFLEQMLQGYSRSARTQEILEAFTSLIELQGDLEEPSGELSSVIDWLQDSSTRRLSVGARSLIRPGVDLPQYSDLLREAYQGARGGP